MPKMKMIITISMIRALRFMISIVVRMLFVETLASRTPCTVAMDIYAVSAEEEALDTESMIGIVISMYPPLRS